MKAILAIRVFAVTLTLGTLGFSQSFAPPLAPGTRYFLRDDLQGRWCVYSNKETWDSRVNSVQPEMAGGIEYHGGRVSRIYLQQQNSNVEWVLHDWYELNRLGQIVGLLRNILYVSEHEVKQESYQIAAGKATKTASSAWNPVTSESLPLPRPMDADATWQVFTRIKDLPFTQLIEGRAKRTLSKEGSCVPVRNLTQTAVQ